MKKAKEIFEAYNGLDCQDYLYKLRTKTIQPVIDSEPEANGWTVFTDEDENEIPEDDLEIYKEYSSSFEQLKNESEALIADFCYDMTVSKDLYELLEDVFYNYMPRDNYNAFHNLLANIESGQIEDLDSLYDLAKSESTKNLFIQMISIDD